MQKTESPTTKVNVATLKNELSRYLRMIKAGGTIEVLEHKKPIARLIPVAEQDGLVIETASTEPKRVFEQFLAQSEKTRPWNSLDYLLLDRRRK